MSPDPSNTENSSEVVNPGDTNDQVESEQSEKSVLEAEYGEACQDWRQRDKYVLDKLGTAALLYGIIGIAFGSFDDDKGLIIKLLLLVAGLFFSLILTISVAKDTYYQVGSEKLIRYLALKLGIADELNKSDNLKSILYIDKKGKQATLDFPRKIYVKRDDPAIKIWKPLRNFLLNRTTFNWILLFYIISFLVFLTFIVILLVNWVNTL